jgi:Ger(x)C family germination protein
VGHKGTRLLWLLFFFLFLGGCTRNYPIEDLDMVYVLGIDKGEESHHAVSVKIPNFEPGAEEKSIFVEGQGVSVSNALVNINRQIEKHLALGQTRTVVIGEELARSGIESHLDILTREPEFPLNAGVLISECKARDFIKEGVTATPRFGDYLKRALNTWQGDGYVLGTSLTHFYIRRDAEGWDACLPYVKRQKDKIAEVGVALFKDEKMVAQLGSVESQLLVLLASQDRKMYISFDDPLEPDTEITDRKYVSVEVIEAKNKVKTSFENGIVQVDMEIKMNVEIVDKESLEHLIHPNTIKVYEESFSKEFSRRAQSLVEKLQEWQVDPLGVGAYFRMQNYDIWKEMSGDDNWRDFWQSAEVQVRTDITLRRFGIVVK